ncbi:MAG: ribonuclease III [Alphaproteobacteria bacterium]|nr:MAG: ribonuclease III [Alphaproteobacteria bacterium]
MDGKSLDWVERVFGHRPRDPALFERALTHSSFGSEHYERLEFLGDRVLGLVTAHWLIETYPDEAEGKLSQRLNSLVTGDVCAEIAREIGLPSHLRLGKQAQDDGVFQSDNVLGDVVEALLGALYLEAGLDAAARFIRSAWGERVDRLSAPPKHPKAELQEWTAAQNRRPPVYTVVATSGPDHAPRFTVEVSIKGKGEATAEGSSKQEAETAAAATLLERLR